VEDGDSGPGVGVLDPGMSPLYEVEEHATGAGATVCGRESRALPTRET